MTRRREGQTSEIHVSIRLFEGVGTDGRAEWEAFFLLTKVRNLGGLHVSKTIQIAFYFRTFKALFVFGCD